MTKDTSELAVRAFLHEAIPRCGVCDLAVSGHGAKHVASVPVKPDDPAQALQLLQAVKACAWADIDRFHDWNGAYPNVDVYALKCPGGGCSLAVILSPFDLNGIPHLLHQQPVPSCDGLTTEPYSIRV